MEAYQKNIVDYLNKKYGFYGKTVLEAGSDLGLEAAKYILTLGAEKIYCANPALSCESNNENMIVISDFSENAHFDDAQFDIILAIAFLEHCNDLSKFSKQVKKWLNSEGICYLHGNSMWTSPNGHHIYIELEDGSPCIFNNETNPFAPWEHLALQDITAMVKQLQIKGYSYTDAKTIAYWIFDPTNITRKTPTKIIQEIKSSSKMCYDVTRRMTNISLSHGAEALEYSPEDLHTQELTIEITHDISSEAKNQKILFVYHNNVFEPMGCNNYAMQLLLELKEMGFIIDFLGIPCSCLNYEKIYEQNIEKKIFRNVFLYDNSRQATHTLSTFCEGQDLGWVNIHSISYFQSLIDTYKYDILYFHYSPMLPCVELAENIYNAKVVFSFIDSTVHQHYFTVKALEEQHLNIGNIFQIELEHLKCVNSVLCVSNDEKIFYEKFFPDKDFYFIPSLLEAKDFSHYEKSLDLLFIGFSNPYNLEGLIWLTKHVLPKLSARPTFGIVGNIAGQLKSEHPNIYANILALTHYTEFGVVEDIDEIYKISKISLCPLLEGTGIKIKVLDSLSRGIPVVCTERGTDGIPDKNFSSCLVSNNPDIFVNNIEKLLLNDQFWFQVSCQALQYFRDYLGKHASLPALKKGFSTKKKNTQCNIQEEITLLEKKIEVLRDDLTFKRKAEYLK